MTTVPHACAVGEVKAIKSREQVIVHAATVTENMQLAVLVDVSVDVQATVVVPTGKSDPDGGTQPAVTPGQLSEAVGAG